MMHFVTEACFLVRFQDDANANIESTMQRCLNLANAIEQMLLPCADFSFQEG